MKRKEVTEYVAPELEVQEVMLERGIAQSNFGIGNEEIEDWEELG